MTQRWKNILQFDSEWYGHSPQQHHAVCHEGPDSHIWNTNISLIDSENKAEDIDMLQDLLTALFTPADPEQCTEVLNRHAG